MPSKRRIDIHVHALSLDPATGCYVSDKLRNRLTIRIMKKLLGIGRKDPDSVVDKKIQARFAEDIQGAGGVDHIVVLALDAVYNERGDLDEAKTHFYVPNDYLFALAESNPKLLPGASVNPNRRDALRELERCIQRGAALIKWLPNTQGFNPNNDRYKDFFRMLQESGTPLLCHTGYEHSLGALNQSFGDPENLCRALDEGVTVIAAHGGGSEIFRGRHFNRFIEMLRTYSNLYADTSALTLPLRKPYLIELLNIGSIHHKLVHGSDYPLPVSAWAFLNNLPFDKIRFISKVRSPIERDYRIKEALGFPEEIFRRGYDLIKPS